MDVTTERKIQKEKKIQHLVHRPGKVDTAEDGEDKGQEDRVTPLHGDSLGETGDGGGDGGGWGRRGRVGDGGG